MSEQFLLRTPQAVTQELDISSATLRRWAEEFVDFLSSEASSAQGKSHRRYTDQDVQTLQVIKALLNDGLTYEQVRQQLAVHLAVSSEQFAPEPGSDEGFEEPFDMEERKPDLEEESKALITSNGNESPAIAFLTNTLTTLSDTQQSILNSQAANRELLGVLIQDNFNLKEENNRLRERILEIERSLAQSRQEDEWRRESIRQELDTKIGSVQQMAAEAMRTAHEVEMPEIKAIKSKPGCLGSLLGLSGDTQIVSVPRKRKGTRQTPQPGGMQPGVSPGSQTGPPSQGTSPAYPKPTAPPE
jgi:DNA-binding transcriptional MerR regulator